MSLPYNDSKNDKEKNNKTLIFRVALKQQLRHFIQET